MSYTTLLIHSCITQRYTSTEDAYGQPVKTWATNLTEDCRLVTGAGKELTIGAVVVIADYKLFLGDVDITEQDRVVIDSVTYEVLLVMDRANGADDHHKECFLRAVR